jgi:hypothetical protein
LFVLNGGLNGRIYRIDLPSETRGLVPNDAYYDARFPKQYWHR